MGNMQINYGKSDRLFQLIIVLFMSMIMSICIYPLLYVLSMSISDSVKIAVNPVVLFPRGISFAAMEKLFEKSTIWGYYYNTIWYTVVGTVINIVLTIMLAYPLSRKDFGGRKFITILITFTMLFSGGLIPTYMLVSRIGLYNTRWALVLPTAVSVFNTILARTFFMGIPNSLAESAKLDGANDIVILTKIILPVSKAIISTLCIYYAVAHWNSYLSALLYLSDMKLHPLQMFLVKVLINNDPMLIGGYEESIDRLFVAEQLKYAAIVISVLPILCVYPFFQKYFTKGVMLGSLKG